MTNNNHIKLTQISFLSYALTGALITATGMVMGNIADYLNLPTSNMSNTFTFLNAGILISISLNAWLMEIVPLKTQLCFGFLLMVLAVAGLMFSYSLALFLVVMFIFGMVNGITMSIGTSLITQIYERRRRGSRLLSTDPFFSMAEMIFLIIATFLLMRSIKWYWAYAYIGPVYVAIFILIPGRRFPAPGKYMPKTDTPVEREKWGVSVLFLPIATLCYIPGQLGFISWVLEYTKGLGMNLNDASTLVSNFWMSYVVGMWVLSFILRFLNSRRILTVLVGLAATLIYVPNAETLAHVVRSILALDFFSSAIYTTIVTLDSQQIKVPSPKLVNSALICGTIDIMLILVVTGPTVEHSGPQATLLTANGLYAVAFVICFLLGFVSHRRQHNALTPH